MFLLPHQLGAVKHSSWFFIIEWINLAFLAVIYYGMTPHLKDMRSFLHWLNLFGGVCNLANNVSYFRFVIISLTRLRVSSLFLFHWRGEWNKQLGVITFFFFEWVFFTRLLCCDLYYPKILFCKHSRSSWWNEKRRDSTQLFTIVIDVTRVFLSLWSSFSFFLFFLVVVIIIIYSVFLLKIILEYWDSWEFLLTLISDHEACKRK